MNWPRRRNSNTKNDANSDRFNDRRQSFIIVYTMLLRETSTNPACFITRESAVGVELMPENPFARNNIGVGWARNELPSVIGEEGVKLITHGLGPVGFEKS